MTSFDVWKNRFELELLDAGGPLSVVSIHVLERGVSSVGRTSNCKIIVESEGKGPSLYGTFAFGDQVLIFTPASGVPVVWGDRHLAGSTKLTLSDSMLDNTLRIGPISLQLFRFADHVSVLARNAYAKSRLDFGGLRWESEKKDYRTIAKFFPWENPVETTSAASPFGWGISCGTLRFELFGKSYTFEVFRDDLKRYVVPFSDAGNGPRSYLLGRQVFVDLSNPQRVELDFNRAHTPDFARVNVLPRTNVPALNAFAFLVDVGELFPHTTLFQGADI